MTIVHLVFFILAAAFIVPLVWWSFQSVKAERQRTKQAAAEQAAYAKARREFKRKVYPALQVAPPPACRNAQGIPLRLELSESLASDVSALMSTQVILDGECVYSPWTQDLVDRTGRRIQRLADVEAVASKYAHQEWLVKFVQPLQSLVYQRHADGCWNLVGVGKGMF